MLEKIAAFIADQLDTVKAEDITPETNFKEDLNADSLDLFELVMKCESEYGIEFDTEELEKIETVGDMIKYIKQQGISA